MNLNYRNPKFNAYGNLSGIYNKFKNYNWYNRENRINDTVTYIDQIGEGFTTTLAPTVNGGVEYYADKFTTIGISGLYSHAFKENPGTINYSFKDS